MVGGQGAYDGWTDMEYSMSGRGAFDGQTGRLH